MPKTPFNKGLQRFYSFLQNCKWGKDEKIYERQYLYRKGGVFNTMNLQDKTKKYLEENGIMKKHLSSLLGIYPVQLYKWFLGEYKLNDTQIKTVKSFIKDPT